MTIASEGVSAQPGALAVLVGKLAPVGGETAGPRRRRVLETFGRQCGAVRRPCRNELIFSSLALGRRSSRWRYLCFAPTPEWNSLRSQSQQAQ